MSIEGIAIIITTIISIVSLIISLKNYFISKPKLKIVISDKNSDIYFGTVCAKDEKVVNTNIGAAEINIINNSPVDIFIKEINLKIGKNYHRLVLKDNPFWEFTYFFYYDENKEKFWDGAGINYNEVGFEIPVKVKSYTILSGICLFHDFPNVNSKKVKGKIILNTAIGKAKKKVKFIRYNEDYTSKEMKDVELYQKNIIK